jgi:hypothetical protein
MYATVTITLPISLAEKIEKERGKVPRSKYISRLLETADQVPQTIMIGRGEE